MKSHLVIRSYNMLKAIRKPRDKEHECEGNYLKEGEKKLKRYFRLNSPKKGYGKNGKR